MGSVVTEDLKGGGGGSLKSLEGFKRSPLKFAWKMKSWWGGSRQLSNVIREGHFSEVTFKGRDQLNFTLFSTKSSLFNRWYYNLLVIS